MRNAGRIYIGIGLAFASGVIMGYTLDRMRAMRLAKHSSTITLEMTAISEKKRRRTIRSPYGKFRVERSATHAGVEYAVRDGIVIGKMNADIIITDPLVSRRHARVQVQDSRVLLEDLGSTNGTFVRRDGRDEELNGTPFELRHGDEVYLGPPDEPDAVVLRYIRES